MLPESGSSNDCNLTALTFVDGVILNTFVIPTPRFVVEPADRSILGQVRLSAKAGLSTFGSRNWMKEVISPANEAKKVGDIGARVWYHIGNCKVGPLG
jgi:hypothetical protein